MVHNLKGKDVLAVNDWSKSELDQVLDMAFRFKNMGEKARALDILKGKTLLMLFFLRSTRTKISFTAAMEELGGFVQCPNPDDLRLSIEEKPGIGESIKDTARVIERYVDAVGIRAGGPIIDSNKAPKEGGGDALIRKFAEYTDVPVINLAACMDHPTQALADVMVMKENLGNINGKKILLMWAYSPILRSWSSIQADALISSLYGMNVTIACPEGYILDPTLMSIVERTCTDAGKTFEITHDLTSALEGADVVFPRHWWSPNYYVHTKEEEIRLADRHKNWKLTEKLIKLTNNARFMHVMPFDRGNEVDDSVADGPNSIVYDQAENLLYVRKAFLASILIDNNNLEIALFNKDNNL